MASKINDFKEYFDIVVSKEMDLKPYEDPALNTGEVLKRLKSLQKLWKKVSEKKKPKPPKEEKKEEEK